MLGYICTADKKIAIEAKSGELLADIAKKYSIEIDSPCGKNGKGKCESQSQSRQNCK